MTFTPIRSDITNITNANPAVVTTAQDHGLYTGNVIRLNVPFQYGMFEIDKLVVSVTVLSTTSFSCQLKQVPTVVNLNTTLLPAFVTPTNPGYVASVIPIGSGPSQITDVAWQVNNNFGDSTISDTFLNNSL